MTWRRHTGRILAKVLRTYIRIYPLFRSERLSANIKLVHYGALIGSVMVYVCPIWEYAADCRHLNVQRLQNRVLRAIGNLEGCILVSEMHLALKIPYVYDYKTKLCRTEAEVILNHVNPNS
jgi:hypothetical protein